jgi:riboflavin-specific deaminase-like protein
MVGVQTLWPIPNAGGSPTDLTDTDLERIYAYPPDLDRPWLQANFVSSADGAVTVRGRSEGLSHPADKRVFLLHRDLADVVLVGAGTVKAENYGGARVSAARTQRRRRLGLSEVPPVAVVSGRASIEPDSRLFTDTRVPPIVFTTASASEKRRAALAEAGADVVVAGRDRVNLHAALAELDARGLRRITCEGGPHLFGELIAEDLVDELNLTLAPLLEGGAAGRIAIGPVAEPPRRMTLGSVLHEDGFTMLRYRRDRPRPD